MDVKARGWQSGSLSRGLASKVAVRRSFQVALDRAATGKLADMLEKCALAELKKQRDRGECSLKVFKTEQG